MREGALSLLITGEWHRCVVRSYSGRLERSSVLLLTYLFFPFCSHIYMIVAVVGSICLFVTVTVVLVLIIKRRKHLKKKHTMRRFVDNEVMGILGINTINFLFFAGHFWYLVKHFISIFILGNHELCFHPRLTVYWSDYISILIYWLLAKCEVSSKEFWLTYQLRNPKKTPNFTIIPIIEWNVFVF